jgi:hypothetical protein
MINKLARFFYKRLYRYLVPLWYGLTMNLTRLRRWPEIDHYMNTREITEALRWGEAWRPDPLRGVLDVLMDPRKFQKHINDGDSEFGDCDDHAMYWCTALLQSAIADRAWFASVWYARPGEKGSGHVVCVFERGDMYFWVDYGDPRPAPGAWEWAKDVADSRGKELIAAGMTEVTLRANLSPKFRFKGAQTKVV